METEIKRYSFIEGYPFELVVQPLSQSRETPCVSQPSRAAFYHIIWLTEGHAVFNVDFRQIEINAGEMFMISINQVYQFDLENHYEGKSIFFTEAFFSQSDLDTVFLHTSEFLNPDNQNHIVKLDNERLSFIYNLLDNEMQNTSDKFQQPMAKNLLQMLLMEAERSISGNNSPIFLQADKTVGRRFCDEVEKSYKEYHSVDYYQNILAVTEKVLSREVKRQTGKTPKSYIDDRIILETKRLLSYSVLTVKEISIKLGFDEQTNFNKFFRRHTGTTPASFRQARKI